MSLEDQPLQKEPKGYVYRLTVEPDWGRRGTRTEYEFFFPEQLGRCETRDFLDAQQLSGCHHSWKKIQFASRQRTVTSHGV